MINRTSALGMAVLLLALLLPTKSAQDQEQKASAASSGRSEAQILEDLVAEVRQVRLALERTTSINSRLQITLQRVQLQQNQVSRISSQLESLHDGIGRLESEQSDLSNHMADIESRIEQEQNADRQKELQSEQKQIKFSIDQKGQAIQEQRTREGELTSQLQVEQSRLNQLQADLDLLEKQIEAETAH